MNMFLNLFSIVYNSLETDIPFYTYFIEASYADPVGIKTKIVSNDFQYSTHWKLIFLYFKIFSKNFPKERRMQILHLRMQIKILK